MGETDLCPRSRIHSFNIDDFLDPIVPRPRLHYLPRTISHFFGYRPPAKESNLPSSPVVQPSNLYVWLFSFLGGFVGIAIIENVYLALPPLNDHQAPLVIASFGAAAILEYNTIESPLAQPRNLFVGHLLSTIVGVGITKLFALLPPSRFNELRWLAGALSVGVASTVMAITKTVHPPAGATALLAATSIEVTDLGWWLPLLVVLGCSLMLASALLINNLYKRFPLYWWTPADLSQVGQRSSIRGQNGDISKISDAEKGDVHGPGSGRSSVSSIQPSSLAPLTYLHEKQQQQHQGHDHDQVSLRSESDLTVTNSRDNNILLPSAPHRDPSPIRPTNNDNSINPRSNLDATPEHRLADQHQTKTDPRSRNHTLSHELIIPDWIQLSDRELEALEEIRARLCRG